MNNKNPIRLSYSSVTSFKACPQKYYFNKKYTGVLRPSAFAFGSAVEEGVTTLIKTRDLKKAQQTFAEYWEHEDLDINKPVLDNPYIEYGKNDLEDKLILNFPEYTQYFNDLQEKTNNEYGDEYEPLEIAMANRATLKITDPLNTFLNRCFWLSMREKGYMMLQSLFDTKLNEIEGIVNIGQQPGCQLEIKLENEEGDYIIGYIDYLLKIKGHDKPVIIDCKTAAWMYDDHKLITSGQLKTYCAALQDIHNLDTDVGYLVLGKKLKKQKKCIPCGEDVPTRNKICPLCKKPAEVTYCVDIQLLTHSFTDDELDAEMGDYENILNSISNEICYKNPDSCMAFYRECEYYGLCWRGQTIDDIPGLEEKNKGIK